MQESAAGYQIEFRKRMNSSLKIYPRWLGRKNALWRMLIRSYVQEIFPSEISFQSLNTRNKFLIKKVFK